MTKKRLAIILGIRPDVIRAALVLEKLRAQKKHEIVFIWSGQHYSDNLKDIFFRDLNVAPPEIELGVDGNSDAEIVASVISKLSPVLVDLQPEAAVFLGDTNTVIGCLAAAQQNIPIVHIEGCMRSYDWRMPEEKYRSVIDHLSDVIYTYFPEYKQQGIYEGINPDSIILVTNLIVDILIRYYFDVKDKFDKMATTTFFSSRGIEINEYYLMTCHRRENVHIQSSFENILSLIAYTDRKIYFPASYRTQKLLIEYGLSLPKNVIMVDPIGYTEMLVLMANSRGVITDSGTVVEETCVLQVPSLQMRKATERPQVYDAGSSVKYDPAEPHKYEHSVVFDKLEKLYGKKWEHNLGDGKASERLVSDLLERLDKNAFRRHKRQDYHLPTDRSYRDDGL
ncbi:MAG: UDP-N-acetylglucosamine 2-epimerase [Parcubacteria group bacterium GW2011_GWC2_38_7]|nr:MAG: UDP-N-acetylglucosamine 2-epimerase [Parcubacteria group bacterium GW2011_GWC2_38_7]